MVGAAAVYERAGGPPADLPPEIHERFRRLAYLQRQIDVHRHLLDGQERLLRAQAVAPADDGAAIDSRELRRLSRDVRALSASMDGNTARLEALRSQTRAVGDLANEVSELASSATRALVTSAALHSGPDSWRLAREQPAGPGSAAQAQGGRGALGAEDASAAASLPPLPAASAQLQEARLRMAARGLRATSPAAGGDSGRHHMFRRLRREPGGPRAAAAIAAVAAAALAPDLAAADEPGAAGGGIPRARMRSALVPRALERHADDVCAVCLHGMRAGQEVVSLPACAHDFHVACIREACAHRAACPLCRTAVRWW